MFVCFLGDIAAMIALQPALKFNGGGHINHSIFWTNLSPNSGGEPTGISMVTHENIMFIKTLKLNIFINIVLQNLLFLHR